MKNKKLLLIPTFLLVLNCSGCDNHEHNFAIDKHDENGHWKECECGEKEEVVAHTLVDKYDEANHWKECTCGYVSPKVSHTLQQKNNDTQHWQECSDCAYVSEKVNHNLNDRVDDNNHWSECDCGFSTTKVAHTLEDKYDNAQHWQECSECLYETTRENHEFEKQDDFYSHWLGCKNCEYDDEKTTHYYQVKYDDNNHWQECSCGKKVEVDSHRFTMKHDSENHWQACPCGKKKDISSHNFGDLIVDTAATCVATGQGHRACEDCGEIKNEVIPIDPNAHDIVETTVDPTNYKCGSITRTCKNCDFEEVEKIPHTGSHSYETWYTPMPNGTQCGTKCHCEGCDYFFMPQAHSYVYVVDREPDGDTPGLRHLECENCHIQKGESEEFNATKITDISVELTLPRLGDLVVNQPLTAINTPGVKQSGVVSFRTTGDDYLGSDGTKYITRDYIGKQITVNLFLGALDGYFFHLDSSGYPEVQATLNGIELPLVRLSGYKSGDCWGFRFNYEITEEHEHVFTKNPVLLKEANDTQCGLKQYTCQWCDETTTEIIPHTGNHQYTKNIPLDENTHIEACSIENCSAIGSTTSSHTFNMVIDRMPSGDTKGLIHYECSECKFIQTNSQKEVDAIPINSLNFRITLPASGKTTLQYSFSNDSNNKINVLCTESYYSGHLLDGSYSAKLSRGSTIMSYVYFTCETGYDFMYDADENPIISYYVNNNPSNLYYAPTLIRSEYKGKECWKLTIMPAVGYSL